MVVCISTVSSNTTVYLHVGFLGNAHMLLLSTFNSHISNLRTAVPKEALQKLLINSFANRVEEFI